MGIDLLQDTDDVGDVSAERAERLLNGLLVADVGIDRMEERQLRAALGRDVQSALGHEGKETDGLQGDSFAARIRTRDNDGACARPWIYVDRNNGVGIEQRVSGLHELDGPWTIDAGRRSFFSMFSAFCL